MAGLLFAAVLSSSALLYKEGALGTVEVGVVRPSEDELSAKAMEIIVSMESTGAACHFTELSEEDGRKALTEGTLSALMILPEGLVKGIMDGSNPPVRVVFPANAGMESAVLRALTDSGAELLHQSQAAIYAADAWLLENGLEMKISDAERLLNSEYIRYALDRENLFRKKHVSATGEVSPLQYFFLSAWTMLLFLAGIPAAPVLRPFSPVTEAQLRREGIGPGKRFIGKWACMLLLEGLLMAVVMAFVLLFLKDAVPAAVHSGNAWAAALLHSLPALLIVSFLIVLIFSLCREVSASILVLFLLTVLMAFAAGGIIPSVFLPETVQKIGGWTPYHMVLQILKQAFAG